MFANLRLQKQIFIAKRYNCRKTKQRVHEILPCDVNKKNKKNKWEKFLYLRNKSLE